MNALDYGKKIIDSHVRDKEIPGACFALVTREGTRFGCTGYKSLVPRLEKVSNDTLYDLASVTKAVSTTTVVLKLIEEGCFTLDTPLSDLLPDFPHKKVTIKQILTHTSGICHDDKAYKAFYGKSDIWNFFKNKPLEFEPGADLSYSDFGYIALGFAAEKFVGSLETFSEKTIFQPLKMNETVYRPAAKGLGHRCAPTEQTADRGIICGEVHDGKAWRLSGVSGNAGLFSTTADLSRFVLMLLNGGEWDGARILSESTINLLKRCYTQGYSARRTLGWICNDPAAKFGDYYSDVCLFHTGFAGTSVYVDFVRRCGILLLTNRIHPSRDNVKIQEIRNQFHNVVLLHFDEEERLKQKGE